MTPREKLIGKMASKLGLYLTQAEAIIDYLKLEAVDNDADNFRAKRKGLNVININNLGD